MHNAREKVRAPMPLARTPTSTASACACPPIRSTSCRPAPPLPHRPGRGHVRHVARIVHSDDDLFRVTYDWLRKTQVAVEEAANNVDADLVCR